MTASKKEKLNALRYTAASVLAAMAVQGAAFAQESATSQDEDDTIVVTGIRKSLAENLDVKRNATSIVDSINAEEIGKFPDKNVADALQRIPGVSITRDGGEGARVSIRGLGAERTYTQLNGNYIASSASEPARSFLYTLLPANMISRADVFKSYEAKHDEGGVGGSVVLRTRRPLEEDNMSGFLSAEGTYSDTTEKFEPNYSGLFSVKNEAGTLGLLVSYTNQDRTNRTLGTNVENWNFHATEAGYNAAIAGGHIDPATQRRDPLVDNLGNGATFANIWAPTAVVGIVEEEQRNREGIQATAQWKPIDSLTLTADYFRFDLGGDTVRNRLVLPEWNYGNGIVAGGITLDGSNNVIGLSTTAPANNRLESPQYAGDRIRNSSESNTYTFTAEYESDRIRARTIVGNTKAEGGDHEQFFTAIYSTNRWVADGEPNLNAINNWAWAIDRDGGATITSTDDLAGLANHPNAIALDNFNSSFADSSDEQFYAQFDVAYDVDAGFLDSVEVGGKLRNHEINRRVRDLRFDDANDPADCSRFIPWDPSLTSCPAWLGSGNFVSDLSLHPTGEVIASQFIADAPVDNIAGDALNVAPFSAVDFDGVYAWALGRFGEPTVTTQPTNLYKIEEDHLSGYVQANFSTDRLRGNVGLRVAHIDRAVERFSQQSAPGVDQPEGATTFEASNTEFLPSFNVVYDLTDDIVLRGAVSRSISRASFGALGGAETIIFEAPTNTYRGGGGNPELRAYEAWSFDGSAEWYYAPGSAVSVALSRKEVGNWPIQLTTSVQRVIGTEVVTVDPFNTSVNAGNGVIQSAEVAVQHDFQNGFGILANLTLNDTSDLEYIDDNDEIAFSPFAGVAETQLNLVGYYETEKYSLRLAYNRIGDNPVGPSRGLEVFQNPYQQLDLNATYNVTDNLSLVLQGVNLTKEISRAYAGHRNRLTGASYAGRRFYIGANYRF